jgi:hypothetical protein
MGCEARHLAGVRFFEAWHVPLATCVEDIGDGRVLSVFLFDGIHSPKSFILFTDKLLKPSVDIALRTAVGLSDIVALFNRFSDLLSRVSCLFSYSLQQFYVLLMLIQNVGRSLQKLEFF